MAIGIRYTGPYDRRHVVKKDLGDDAPEGFSATFYDRGVDHPADEALIELFEDRFPGEFARVDDYDDGTAEQQQLEFDENESAEDLDSDAPASKTRAKAGKSRSTSEGTTGTSTSTTGTAGTTGTTSGSTGTGRVGTR